MLYNTQKDRKLKPYLDFAQKYRQNLSSKLKCLFHNLHGIMYKKNSIMLNIERRSNHLLSFVGNVEVLVREN